ncbi:FAD-dependent oxidoreductase [Mesorhizobium sp. CAU 1741]|uniref:FAD-dependent oxidoreductase n=1 Tax=Mesorhizobium sp. CAU 1741 TaxID=3140366 RepID=UPI00325AFF6D
MIVDLHSRPPPQDNEIVIVGSGAVGLSMAVNLSRRGVRVALLEAGPELPDETSQAVFGTATASGRPLPGLHCGRTRALGGTTNRWAGQIVAIDPHVIGQRPWIDSDGWPIAHHDIAPYHDAALSLLEMENTLADSAVWKALNVAPPAATGDVVPFLTRWTPTPRFAKLFKPDIVRCANLRVCLNAQATALRSADGRFVEGVVVASGTGATSLVGGRHVVLACGTVETVRLLFQPLADGRPAPWSGNAWLGRGFMDHVDCTAATVTPLDAPRFADLFEAAVIGGHKYLPKLRLGPSAQERMRLLDVAGHFVHHSRYDDEIEAIKALAGGALHLGPGRRRRMALLRSAVSGFRFVPPMAMRYLRRSRIKAFHDQGITLRLTAEQTPQANSRITARDDRDGHGMRTIDVDWRVAPTQIETLARFSELVRDYLAAQRLATTTIDTRLAARNPDFLAMIDDANHHMGGARMANAPSDGVVDSNLKVFGTHNLHVAGAAVYPTSGFQNPTFTAIALGLRLADSLAAGIRP